MTGKYIFIVIFLVTLVYISTAYLARPFVATSSCCYPSGQIGRYKSGDRMFAIYSSLLFGRQLERGDYVIYTGYDFQTKHSSNTMLGLIEGTAGAKNDVDESSVVNPYIRDNEFIIAGAEGMRSIKQKKDIHYLIWYPGK